jgi:hypothetical protein
MSLEEEGEGEEVEEDKEEDKGIINKGGGRLCRQERLCRRGEE